jgi:hypothetical protein
MYSDTDYQNAKNQMRKYLIVTCVVFLLLLGGMIAGLIVRNKALTIVMAVVASWTFYTMLMLKCMPWIKYVRWLKDMREGLSRETDGWFVRTDPACRLSDGVAVHEFIVRVGDGEEDERLFLWDDDRPLPDVRPDQKVHIKSFGNYVIEFSAGQ